MVILRHGGVYADIDTECGSPLDDIILPDDTFMAGWEDEYANVDAAVDFCSGYLLPPLATLPFW